ncbi:Xin Actin-Binding Repeat-Containing Protein 2 [Manis pentadactyla]|nr:Xin Actin-Binding Repeat-Containing Protein 2 [Manis pentadactyla]
MLCLLTDSTLDSFSKQKEFRRNKPYLYLSSYKASALPKLQCVRLTLMTEGCSAGISVRSVLRPSFVPAFVKETGNPSVPGVPKGTVQMCVEEEEEDQTCKKSLGGSFCSSSPSTRKAAHKLQRKSNLQLT